MADLKISALTSATTPLAGTEVFPLVQSSTTKKATIQDILSAGLNPTFGAVTATSKFVISGNGSTPGASEIGFGSNGVGSRARYNAPSGGEHEFSVNGSNVALIAGSAISPTADNVASAGLSFWRYSVVYAATALINTSDARTKQQAADLTTAEQNVAKRIKGLIKTFKFNDAVEAKGDGARIHVGVIAQEVMAAFEAEGLDPNRYAMFCHDSWEDKFEDIYEEQEVTNANGMVETVNVNTGRKKLIVKAGDRYGIRYDELLAFVISAM
jgi:hypothetical protein